MYLQNKSMQNELMKISRKYDEFIKINAKLKNWKLLLKNSIKILFA